MSLWMTVDSKGRRKDPDSEAFTINVNSRNLIWNRLVMDLSLFDLDVRAHSAVCLYKGLIISSDILFSEGRDHVVHKLKFDE